MNKHDPSLVPPVNLADGMRTGEKAVTVEAPSDASLVFIGSIATSWTQRDDCPRQGSLDGPSCEVVIDDRWIEALAGIERHTHLQVLYWMHQARRDLVILNPRSHGERAGPFSLRAPTRPNPIASSIVALIARRGAVLVVRGLDCLDGTPLLDIKPWRGPF